MIKTILIDDEPLARGIVRHYLSNFSDFEIVAECDDGFEGLKAITEHQPNLVFLDVQMPKISGFEMLELIDAHPAIIFTTAFDEYAIKAFEVNAVDYLLKPIEFDRFSEAIKKIIHKINDPIADVSSFTEHTPLLHTQNNRIVVKANGIIKIVPVAEVIYLEADDDQVKICTQDGNYFKNKTMTFFENSLDRNQFIRIHRSYIINLEELTKIELKEKDSYVVLLKSGIWLPVSKSGYVKLKTALKI